MRKLHIVFFAFVIQFTFAQQPNWYDENQREITYPKGQYFTGIAYGELKSGESVGAVIDRLKTAARVEALSTIRIHVENETRSDLHSEERETLDAWAAEIRETFDIKTTTKVDLEIPGLLVDAWRNPATGDIAAFAYVKKSTLIRQLEKKITVGLTKIETSMDQIDQLVANGQKMQARGLAEKTVPQFLEIDEAQKLLAAVDENADEESLQLQETRSLQHRLTGLVAQIKNGIGIYLANHASLFESSYPELASQIKGCLSSLGCEFVTNVDKSDWEITVISKPYVLKQAIENSFFCRLNTTLKITKRATGQCVYEARVYNDAGMDVKGGSTTSNDDAAVDAYKNLTTIICDIIKQQIQQ